MDTFYLGTHMPGWLFDPRFAGVPLFVSRRSLNPLRLPKVRGPKTPRARAVRIDMRQDAGGRWSPVAINGDDCLLPARRRKPWRRAVTSWALDSGGFQELDLHGRWTITARQYVEEVRVCAEEIGGLEWAACMDWMCEERIRAKTRLSIDEHQRRTIDSYLELMSLAPDLPWAPVLQGARTYHYMRHVDMYDRAGVDLRTLPVVGVGSVCRRQGTYEAAGIMSTLASLGLRLHGFGFKTQGLELAADDMISADSCAWSFTARREAIAGGQAFTHRQCRDPQATHQNCANCPDWALEWRQQVLDAIRRGQERNLQPGQLLLA